MLEEDQPIRSTNIVLLPPNEDNTISDEDSDDDKESGPKDPNHVGRRLMNQQAELETHHPYNSDDEIDAWTEEKDQMGIMKVAQDEAVLDNTMVVPGPSSSNPVRQNPRRGDCGFTHFFGRCHATPSQPAIRSGTGRCTIGF
ncbi:hypothetical protein E2C01_028638 [Portunus trituberculatus]|uniref:Uncharacterized protein n=1 Tax=Portunus trituberculatus TaxID=210409 RepID=A0A5B7EKZ6_PORTR|nr:hypothetical protein [Portunus trituberculatus]